MVSPTPKSDLNSQERNKKTLVLIKIKIKIKTNVIDATMSHARMRQDRKGLTCFPIYSDQ